MSSHSVTETISFAHHPVIPPQIRPRVPRADPTIFDRLRVVPVPDLSDAVGALYTMAPAIGPLYLPAPRLVGQALTAKVPVGDNLTVHGALAMVERGDVLVIDSRGYTDGCATGEFVLKVPLARGLAGAVVDGAWRDIGELQDQQVPIYGLGRSAFSPPKNQPGELNVAVSCGGVVVNPGDFIVADAEGVVVIPKEWITEVLDEVEARAEAERAQDMSLPALEVGLAARVDQFNRIAVSIGGAPLDVPN